MRAWLELARISNLPTVWTNVLAGWLLAGGRWDWTILPWLLVGASLLYTGGMILNDAADLKFDREHRQERPIPSGRVSHIEAWSVGGAFMLAGSAVFVWAAHACPWLVLALVVAILFYDLYHKPWAGSVFVMGSCRTFLYLVAASAVTGGLSFTENQDVILKAIALGGYVVGLSLVARHEGGAKKAGIGWLLLGLFGLILPILVAFVQVDSVNLPYTFGVAVVLMMIVMFAIKLMRKPPKSNIGRAVGLLLAGIVVVDALAISPFQPIAAIFFFLSMPLLLLWQRKIAAT